ncbi:MAG: hypothetical protein K2N58_02385 [Treponemataceae bacterium]|nr:hypothetical protein [Treponemataceae bacterium]
MKKAIGKIFALFLFFNIYGINYKTLKSTKLYESDGTFNYYARDIDKNETVKISKAQIYYGVSDWKYSVEILYHDTHYFTNVENLVPENAQNILSDNISLIHSEDAEWLSSYYFDMLKEQNLDVIKSKQQNGFREYQDRKTEFDYEWYYTLSFLRPTYFFNSVVTISLLFDNCSFLVKNISKKNSDYLIEAEVYDWFMPDATNSYSTGDYVLLKVSADGDYLNLFCDGQLLGQFVKTNNETKTEIKSLMRDNTCDLSKITWPRHADGSCDYDANSNFNWITNRINPMGGK